MSLSLFHITQTQKKLTFLTLFCVGLGVFVVLKAASIQITQDSRLVALAKKQFQQKILIRAKRGNIFDRNNEPLTMNNEVKSLAVNPSKITQNKEMARKLSKALGLSYSSTLSKLRKDREFAWIKRHLDENDLKALAHQGILTSTKDLLDGFWMVKETKRVYPHGELGSNLLGAVNIDSEGIEGVEYWKNEDLGGSVVSVHGIKDALGRPLFIDASHEKDIKDGKNIRLTIDAALQFSTEKELKEAVTNTKSISGSVIVMNADTGEIVSIASYPSYNPNDIKGSPRNRRNLALTDGYEPGSTLKTIILASALSNGMKLTDSVWGERGSWNIQGKVITEAEVYEKFEWINLKKMLTVSSNIGAAKIATQLGAKKILKTLEDFKLGEKTSMGYPGEISGWLPKLNGIKAIELATLGFGQGLLVSPVQVARAYAVILNGGYLVEPKLVMDDASSPSTRKQIISAEVAKQLRESLRSVVETEEGTGKNARVDGLTIAGKTGTSQVVDSSTKRYSKSHYIASFAGFALNVEPRFVILTVLNRPQGVYYASETAAPLFAKIMESVANRYAYPVIRREVIADKNQPMHKNEDQALVANLISEVLENEKDVEALQLEKTKASLIQYEAPNAKKSMQWIMPHLVGMGPREVLQMLESRDFEVTFKGIGWVKAQSPGAGEKVRAGQKIEVRLSEP